MYELGVSFNAVNSVTPVPPAPPPAVVFGIEPLKSSVSYTLYVPPLFIRVTLDTGKVLASNGTTYSKEKFNELLEQSFPVYLENDQTSRQCKKNHRNYKHLVQITKDCFITQVEETLRFFQVEKDGVESYDQLCREVFKSKQDARTSLMRQLDYNEAGIKIVEKDPEILKIITGKQIIVKTLRKGFDITKKELLDGLERAYV